MYQYRITINGSKGNAIDNPPPNWNQIAEIIEERGGLATLERRSVYTGDDMDILALLPDKTGWIVLRDKVISPWVIFAEIEVQ